MRARVLLLAAVVAAVACRQDMHDQPKVRPYRESNFFADGLSARPAIPGTVARGELREDDALYLGKIGNQPVDRFPFAIDRATLERGRERYDIYCAPCHDRVGRGDGMIVKRGYRQPQSFHIDRLRDAPPGHFFDAITNGFGAMPDFRAQIQPEDRWAVVAYIRALQLSQHASESDTKR